MKAALEGGSGGCCRNLVIWVKSSALEGSAAVVLPIEGGKARGGAWLGLGGVDLRLGRLREDEGEEVGLGCAGCPRPQLLERDILSRVFK